MRSLLKKFTSNGTRRKLALALVDLRKPTARWRPLPNLLVIGAQRCGTSSLFKYLGAHPQCEPSIRKEIRFFTEYYGKGVEWYRSHFPLSFNGRNAGTPVFFEATPDYLLDPRVPSRASQLLPGVRIIVLLRDPVERAYSHYWHNRRLGTENLSFPEALEREPERIGAYLESIQRGSTEPTHKNMLRYSYVERGRYAKHLKGWFEVIDKKRALILRSEDLYKDTDRVYHQILSFLGLPEWRPPTYENFSYVSQRPKTPPMPADCRIWLEKELALEIERLEEFSSLGAKRLDGRQRAESE